MRTCPEDAAPGAADIIATSRPATDSALAIATAGTAVAIGVAAALHYARLGLTLSHYDARGHLVVARRIVDSLTPGWQQIGAVWLPLPHLLDALPVQIDFFYRTGAFAIALSIAAFAIAAAAIAWIVRALTGSTAAAVVAAAVFVCNPNVLYLQATPMTEPLLLGLVTLGVALLLESPRSAAGVVLALACLTRYEAWPVTAAALVAAAWAMRRRGAPWRAVGRTIGAIASCPAGAIAAFLIFSRATVGSWFVASGFFVPENKALGQPFVAAAEIVWGTRELSGGLPIVLAAVGVLALLLLAVSSRRRADALVALSLGATAALPFGAFYRGHPFRVRYMVPLIALEAVAAGVTIALVFEAIARAIRLATETQRRRATETQRPRDPSTSLLRGSVPLWRNTLCLRGGAIVRSVVAAAVILVVAYELKPLDPIAPMIVEAQWDRPNVPARRRITDCLRAGYRGDTIMASMGSLGHYMQEAAAAGFDVRDFLHEGNGDLWLAALEEPRPYVGWILIDEQREGGDVLAQRARENPHFLDGFSRVCDGAGVALYRREARAAPGLLRTGR